MSDAIQGLETALDLLKSAREISAEQKDAKAKIIEQAKARAEYAEADSKQAQADEAAVSLENEIKKIALDLAELCAELPERVKVKMFAIVTPYDKVAARDWCFVNFRPALALDEKTFEKAVKDGNIPAELATVIKEARAQIATKL
jgi:hypothetical protein